MSYRRRDEAATRARLFTASRNLIIDTWRSAASRHEQRIEEPPEENVGDTTSAVLDRWLIAEALTSLSAEHRSVISGAYYEGQVSCRHLGSASHSRGHRQIPSALRTQSAQIGTAGERSDPAVNTIPDTFAQWDAAYVLDALSSLR